MGDKAPFIQDLEKNMRTAQSGDLVETMTQCFYDGITQMADELIYKAQPHVPLVLLRVASRIVTEDYGFDETYLRQHALYLEAALDTVRKAIHKKQGKGG